MIQAVIIKAVLKLLKKQFKLDKLLKYVEEPNELDNKCDNLNKRTVKNEKDIEEIKTLLKSSTDTKEDNKWYDK